MFYHYCRGNAFDSLDRVFNMVIEICSKSDLEIKNEDRKNNIVELHNKKFITLKEELDHILIQMYDFSNNFNLSYFSIKNFFVDLSKVVSLQTTYNIVKIEGNYDNILSSFIKKDDLYYLQKSGLCMIEDSKIKPLRYSIKVLDFDGIYHLNKTTRLSFVPEFIPKYLEFHNGYNPVLIFPLKDVH